MKPPVRTAALVFLGGLVLGIFIFHILTFFFVIPYENYGTTTVMIPPTVTVRGIARQLRKEGVISSAWKFELLTRVMRKQAKLRRGEYRFSAPSSPFQALQALLSGKTVLYKVGFPEGTTMNEMAHRLASDNLVELEKFQSMLTDSTLLSRFQIPGTSFEGFLFPDTYHFSKTDGELKILETMVGRFRKHASEEDIRSALEMGLSLLQWVTLASIIEKETGLQTERPLIASVFMNRLNKRMRLQSDPTVIYGIPNFNGNITKKDLQTHTLYNTYTRAGLPPGPIANPGAESLQAAIHPAKTDYLYFVARKDGSHIFAVTYDEHLKNVAYFQLRNVKK